MRVGLYLRLSREDGEGESQSIQSQRLLLTKFCQQQGFAVAAEYVDDGYSGTTFQRPAFAKMLADIEQGRIDTVITKDLSRLGRDYILTGHYLERYFPAHGVRYIALGDNIDTGRGQDDMAPFRAVVNDLYARDISRKVRASLLAKKQAGLFIGARPPYGYRRQAEDKNRLEPDPDTAGVVKQIFCWAAAGWGGNGHRPAAGRDGGRRPDAQRALEQRHGAAHFDQPHLLWLLDPKPFPQSQLQSGEKPPPPTGRVDHGGRDPSGHSVAHSFSSSSIKPAADGAAPVGRQSVVRLVRRCNDVYHRRRTPVSGVQRAAEGHGMLSAFAAGRSCGAGGVALFEGRVGCGSPGDRRRDMQEAAGKLACRGGGTGKAAGRQPPAVGAGSCPRTGLLALEPGKAPPKPTK